MFDFILNKLFHDDNITLGYKFQKAKSINQNIKKNKIHNESNKIIAQVIKNINEN